MSSCHLNVHQQCRGPTDPTGLQKSKKYFEKNRLCFVGILKATGEKSRIRIRIKMSRIHNTGFHFSEPHILVYGEACKTVRKRNENKILDKKYDSVLEF
jgi:hypothetical protein